MQETRVWSLGQEEPLGKRTATHSCILTWRIPWTEEPGETEVHGVMKSQTQLSNLTLALFSGFELELKDVLGAYTQILRGCGKMGKLFRCIFQAEKSGEQIQENTECAYKGIMTYTSEYISWVDG